MNENRVGRRIGLNLEATALIESAVNELKQSKKFIRVNEAKLVSEIIRRFFDKYYEKDKELLEKAFFDQKSYLQNIIQKSNSNQELLDSVASYVNQTKKRGRKKIEN
jgi:hypothetical protein